MDEKAPITVVEVGFAAVGHHGRVRFDLTAGVIQGTGHRPDGAWDGQIPLSEDRREALLALAAGLVPAMQARLQEDIWEHYRHIIRVYRADSVVTLEQQGALREDGVPQLVSLVALAQAIHEEIRAV